MSGRGSSEKASADATTETKSGAASKRGGVKAGGNKEKKDKKDKSGSKRGGKGTKKVGPDGKPLEGTQRAVKVVEVGSGYEGTVHRLWKTVKGKDDKTAMAGSSLEILGNLVFHQRNRRADLVRKVQAYRLRGRKNKKVRADMRLVCNINNTMFGAKYGRELNAFAQSKVDKYIASFS